MKMYAGICAGPHLQARAVWYIYVWFLVRRIPSAFLAGCNVRGRRGKDDFSAMLSFVAERFAERCGTAAWRV